MDTRDTRYHGLRLAAFAVFLLLVLAGCGMPFEWAGKMPDSWGEPGQEGPSPDDGGDPPEPTVMTVRGPSFTLAWDAGGSMVATYRVYWREPGASAWEVLEPAASETQSTESEEDLPYGTYEFAVSSVCPEGEESDLHHSFDDSADPQPWILHWVAV